MSGHTNQFGQPIGPPLPNWTPPPLPPREPMTGRFCRLEPLDPGKHSADLHAAYTAGDGRSWTYLALGPFSTFESFLNWQISIYQSSDPLFFAVVDLSTGKAAGMVSYLRIAPASGSIEVGHIHYSVALQRKPAATESMYLMMRWAFEAGYRRYEWKCDSLNAASRKAAVRLGLTFEGVFRQATVYKGRSRNTAWYAAIDSEWPRLRAAFETWLSPDNFDGERRQRLRLSELTRPS
ncbi:MAG TPA: GNAT family protein [Gemmata sp.]|jgi:RimJ/RimL family protein N-acetyltransferase|nr:GNAT family protein [Gemmata sp.]